jgi:hypothetical protein
LVEVTSQGVTFVGDLVAGGGELLVVDMVSGVGTDGTGFFGVDFIELVYR